MKVVWDFGADGDTSGRTRLAEAVKETGRTLSPRCVGREEFREFVPELGAAAGEKSSLAFSHAPEWHLTEVGGRQDPSAGETVDLAAYGLYMPKTCWSKSTTEPVIIRASSLSR